MRLEFVGLPAFLTAILWGAAIIIFVASVAQSCVEEVEAMEPRIVSIALWQDPDSARFVISWSGPIAAPGTLPIGYYELRIIEVASGDTLGTSSIAAPASDDTVAVSWPAPGDTIPIQGIVAAVDMQGNMGPWGRSPVVNFGVGIVPPFAPDSVGIIQIDSIPMALQIRTIEPRPTFLHLYVTETPDSTWGTTGRLCAMITLYNDSTGFACGREPCSPEANTYCQAVYDRWLLERAA
jgi:hypothetical protein